MRLLKRFPVLMLALALSGCLGMPDTVTPVRGFELERYLGKWYEIARLDHAFERGLNRVTAQYSLRPDGGVGVVNRGYSVEDRAWREVEGKAYFVESPDLGYLKVSFFGPFYGSYVIFELDAAGYEYAFISGPNRSYLWLLARNPEVEEAVFERFRRMAEERGFDLSKLIRVSHD